MLLFVPPILENVGCMGTVKIVSGIAIRQVLNRILRKRDVDE